MSNALKMTHVDFSYDNHVIFKNVNLMIAQQKFVAIIGDNGVGKTTLLKVILGELTVQQGEVFIFDESIKGALSKRKVAYISQQSIESFKQFPTTVEEVIKIHLQFLKKSNDVTFYLKLVNLDVHKHKKLSQLSGGQLQRVAIVLALIQDAPLILLDEPTNNIDKLFSYELYELLYQLVQSGKTVIMVTHHLNDVIAYVDQVIEVSNCQCHAIDKAHYHVTERSTT